MIALKVETRRYFVQTADNGHKILAVTKTGIKLSKASINIRLRDLNQIKYLVTLHDLSVSVYEYLTYYKRISVKMSIVETVNKVI